MLKKVSQMNLKDAQNVEKQEKHKEETTILTTNFKETELTKAPSLSFFECKLKKHQYIESTIFILPFHGYT